MRKLLFLLVFLFVAAPVYALDLGEFNEDVHGKYGTEMLYGFSDNVTALTADYSLTDKDSGKVFTNNGASADITITFGDRPVNFTVFIVDSTADNYTIAVNPSDTDQIMIETNAAGDQISSTTDGAMIELKQVEDTRIWPFVTGTWDDED